MTEHSPEPTVPEAGAPSERAARLARFRGPLEARDAETHSYWRGASPAAHADAMIELAEMAEQIVSHTGFTKDQDEMFPGFPELRQQSASSGDRAA